MMVDFFDKCQDLHVTLMRSIAVALGLEEGFFDSCINKKDNNLRLLHYPGLAPASTEAGKKQEVRTRAGEHSDYGSVTFLFLEEDDCGGLQVRAPVVTNTAVSKEGGEAEEGGEWVDVKAIPSAVVVNAGDLLARWSNDIIRSTRHRVVEPSSASLALCLPGHGDHNLQQQEEEEEQRMEVKDRYSIAYFCNPNFEQWIEALPGTFDNERRKRYGGVRCGDYLVGRLSATY